jgi:putative ABC transport system ATP-binding protein
MPIIEARLVVKTYDTGKVQVKALQGIDLIVEKGEMVAIMGPSGCGKTTLLNCISGIDDVDSGTINIEGQDLAKMTDNAKTDHRAKRMGFIFQAYNLLPVLSAVENVELPLLVGGVKSKLARQKALKALETVGLKEWADHKRWPAAARHHRPVLGERPGNNLGRRAHREPGHRELDAGDGAFAKIEP